MLVPGLLPWGWVMPQGVGFLAVKSPVFREAGGPGRRHHVTSGHGSACIAHLDLHSPLRDVLGLKHRPAPWYTSTERPRPDRRRHLTWF